MLIIYFQSDYIMSFNIIIKYSFLSYHVTTKGKKCMTLKVVVITTFNINTTKFVTLEFVDKIFTTQKPFLILIIPDFLCLAWHIMLITNFELLSETLFNLCLVSLVSVLSTKLQSWIAIFVKKVCCKLPGVADGHSERGFLSWNGEALKSSQIEKAIKSVWKKAGMEGSPSSTLFRKSAASKVHTTCHSNEEGNLADLMAHNIDTARKF